jgi:hypothetical protein
MADCHLSFTCSKLRPDEFGGMAVLITATAVIGKSTIDIINDPLAEAGIDGEGCHEQAWQACVFGRFTRE